MKLSPLALVTIAAVLVCCINIDGIANATSEPTASANASPNAKKSKSPLPFFSRIRDGVNKLFHRNPKAKNDLDKMKEEIQKIIHGEQQVGQSRLHQTSMANPEAFRLMLEKQGSVLALIIENFLTNIPSEADFEKKLQEKVRKMAKEEHATPEPAAAVEMPAEGGNEEQKLEKVAEVLGAVEELGASNDSEKSPVVSSPVQSKGFAALDLSRLKGNSKNKWFAKLKNYINKQRAGLIVHDLQNVQEREEMKNHIKAKGSLKQQYRSGASVSQLATSMLERTHCRGMYRLLKSFRKPSKKNAAEFAAYEAKESEEGYRKRGEIFFNVFLLLHQLEVDAIPALNVDAILDNPDENARNEELDKLMAKLEKFSMSSLLVPFQKNEAGQIDQNGISMDELVAIRALLTEKRLMEAMAERFSSSSSQSTTPSTEGGEVRAKRGVVKKNIGKSIVRGVGYGAAVGAILGGFSAAVFTAGAAGVAILVAFAMIDWCWL